MAASLDPAGLWECDPEVFFRIVERLTEGSKGHPASADGAEVLRRLAAQQAANNGE